MSIAGYTNYYKDTTLRPVVDPHRSLTMEDTDQRGSMEEPDKICVIVHGGKNLQSKKKATEKDDPLGQVIIPLNELPTAKPTPRVAKSSPSGAIKSLKKMKSKISHSPLLRRKSKSGDAVSAGMRGSTSLGDLAGFGRRKTNLLTVPSDSMCSVTSTDSDASNQYTTSCADIRDNLKRPEVSGVSPREGPIGGGTRLTIRGVNLGRDIDDIISLYICGANCTHTVEYESTSKIYVTTIPWKPGPGDIVIQTVSGGHGSSLVQFLFVTDDSKTSPLPTRRIPEVSGISPKEGSTEGGTKLTIRGQNLGRNRADVLRVTVCGQDSTDTLGYESPRKLVLTTKPSKACTGEIIVETSSGGKGSSNVKFSYVTPEPSPETVAPMMQQKDPSPQQFNSTSGYFNGGENLLAPEVTGLSPGEGPAVGGTRLTLRGINLGQNKADVIGLTVGGVDCLSTLEYISPMKLCCTTQPAKPGTGKIIVETKQGGTGSSLVSYTFQKSKTSSPARAVPDKSLSPPPSKPPRKSIGTRDSRSPIDLTDLGPFAEPTVMPAEPSKPIREVQDTQPSILVTGVCQDESTDYFAGATPYPEDPEEPFKTAGAVPYPAAGAPVPAGHTDSGLPGHHTDSASPAGHGFGFSSDSSDQHLGPKSRPPAPEAPESRPRPVGQEKGSSPLKEQKQPPVTSAGGDVMTHHKPPPHPSESRVRQAANNEGSRQVLIDTEDTQLITQEKAPQDDIQKPNQDGKKEKSKGSGFLSKIIGQDKKEQYIKEQEREVQSELHEQNHMMKQYLERLLSNVMIHCPEVLCIDSSQHHGNY
ncbi:hypothetical protein LSH36_581g03055 [Paralvinella palmiformis]|uniref:Exocyst complex component 2 n=1 Tax=Paralvinella palmiformis TaxID=53620 RepID=A0AAD9MWZ7_9ANNE|nr:hypothetical protein LSH36_581g03055 [Paralvinella palmiformis]